jgi:hypothetical protein
LFRHIIKADVEGSTGLDFEAFAVLEEATGFAEPLTCGGAGTDSTELTFAAGSMFDFFFLVMVVASLPVTFLENGPNSSCRCTGNSTTAVVLGLT